MNNINSSQRRLIDIENRQRYIFSSNKQYLNLSSNDYLSLSDINLQQEFIAEVDPLDSFALSNPSSRLMTGNSIHYSLLENSIASLFKKEAALVLSCGYMVNMSLLGALTDSHDLIVADKLVHASMIDGIKLSPAHFERYRHNDMEHLRTILSSKRSQYNNVYIMSESIFSMDGDTAPLTELIAIKNEFDCKLYLDEAHAFGVRGESGAGLAEELNVGHEIDLIVATLGKAAASQGGFVVCSAETKKLLINRMRGLIFSTAIPDISLRWSRFIVERMSSFTQQRQSLATLSQICRQKLNVKTSSSHIIPIIVGSNDAAVQMQESLKELGYWVNAIRHPTVAKGSERLRISLAASIEEAELNEFIKNLVSLQNK